MNRDATEHRYRSGEARTDLVAAIGGFAAAASQVLTNAELRSVAAVFMAFAGYCVWRSIQAWHKPYVQLDDNRLVVFERGRPKHYIELAAVGSVHRGFNQTVLLMRDGMKISISHLEFITSEDAQHFRQTLAERFGQPPS